MVFPSVNLAPLLQIMTWVLCPGPSLTSRGTSAGYSTSQSLSSSSLGSSQRTCTHFSLWTTSPCAGAPATPRPDRSFLWRLQQVHLSQGQSLLLKGRDRDEEYAEITRRWVTGSATVMEQTCTQCFLPAGHGAPGASDSRIRRLGPEIKSGFANSTVHSGQWN